MKKFFVSMVFALSALVMLTGCVVSEEKLTDKVTQGIVEYEQELQGCADWKTEW